MALVDIVNSSVVDPDPNFPFIQQMCGSRSENTHLKDKGKVTRLNEP